MKPEEIQTILEAGVTLNNTTYILIILSGLASGFLGSSLSSYMKEKGKNYATKEDLDDLKTQTKELTTATELVKAEISDKNLKSTKQWELKFSIYTEVLESLAGWRIEIEKMTKTLFQEDGSFQKEMDSNASKRMGEKIESIFSNMAKTEALAEIVFSNTQSEEIRAIRKTATKGIENVSGKAAFDQSVVQIQNLEIKMAREAKRELFG